MSGEQPLLREPETPDLNQSQGAAQQPEQSHAAKDVFEGKQSEQFRAVETKTPNNDGKKPEAEVQPRNVATPCRADPQNERREATSPVPSLAPSLAPSIASTLSDSDVPDLGDGSAPRPSSKNLRITEAAADARLRRTMAPSLRDGSYKVSTEVYKQYRKGGKSKKSLMKLCETCGYCQDWFGEKTFPYTPNWF